MTSRDFCYWLQGMFELNPTDRFSPRQMDLIQRHLNMVFIHEIDPSFPTNQQEALNNAHSGAIAKC